jgi:hypothetical protein
VEVERTVRQPGGGRLVDGAAPDGRPRQVLHLRRIEVAGVDEQHAVLGHRPQTDRSGNQLRAVSDQDAQRHPAEITRGGRLDGLHVAVRVEPDDRGIDPGALQSAYRAERCRAVAGHHCRTATASHHVRDGCRDLLVQDGHSLPGVAGRQLGKDRRVRRDRGLEGRQVLVEVVRHQERAQGVTVAW